MSKVSQQFLQNHRVTISTLSPIHIGCGEDYEPTNYVMNEQALFYFNLPAVVGAFTVDDRKELENINNEREPLLRLQNFFASRKERLMALASSVIPTAPAVYEKYNTTVGRVANVESTGRKVFNALQIERMAFNPHSLQTLIPGSSLKGAIRTALLNSLNKGQKTKYSGRTAHTDLEREKFQGAFDTDPLRLIKISDASLNSGDVLLSRIVFENNVPRKAKDNQSMQKGKSSSLSVMREVYPELVTEAFTAQLSIQDLQGVKLADKTPNIQFTVEDVAQACNDFYLDIFIKELERLNKRGCLDKQWYQHCQKILNLITPFIKNQQGILLRVGRHSGAESVTVDGVRDIKIMQGPSKNPLYQEKATTDWLVSEQEKTEINLMPFGWIFLDLGSTDRQADRQALSDYLRQASQVRLNAQQRLLDSIRETQQQAQQQVAEQRAKEQEKELARLAAEQAEQEKQHALANMSDEERMMAMFVERMDGGEDKGKGAGCVLATDLVQLCSDAATWEVELKAKVYNLAVTVCQYLEIDPKGKKWKPRLQALKN